MIFVDGDVKGADVSFYQDDNLTPQQIDFNQMVLVGADYVIIRAGQNLWIDPDFEFNWEKAKLAGIPRGAYWFYDSRADPEKQAIRFAELFYRDPPELELWLDLEENYRGAYAGYIHWKKFLNKLRQLLPNVRIGIYTGYGYIKGKIPAVEYFYFSQFPLWIAWYVQDENGNFIPKPSSVLIPAPWTSCIYYQWGTPPWGVQWGCESIEIDMNLFNGTREEFYQQYSLSESPPPTGEPMSYLELRPNEAGEWRSIRNQTNHPTVPHIFGTTSVSRRILANSSAKANTDAFYVYESNVTIDGVLRAKAGDIWYQIFEANGVPTTGWVAGVHLGQTYLTVTEVGEPDPPPSGHVVEVYIDGILEFRKEL